jgi:hypothetical protein
MGARAIVSLGWISCIALTLPACGDEDDDGDKSSSGVIESEADFLAQFPTLACRGLETCCQEAGLGYNGTVCQALTAPAPVANAVFDLDAARRCIAALERPYDCSGATTPECDRVYMGMLAPGDVCSVDAECMAPEGGTATCDGTCTIQSRGTAGEACSASCESFAGSGWICTGGGLDEVEEVQCWRDDGLICREGMCTALGGPGDECFFDDECRDDAYCDGTACQTRVEAGAACTTSSECATSTYCAETCTPQLGEGEACSDDEQCLGQNCAGTCGPNEVLDAFADFALAFICGG